MEERAEPNGHGQGLITSVRATEIEPLSGVQEDTDLLPDPVVQLTRWAR